MGRDGVGSGEARSGERKLVEQREVQGCGGVAGEAGEEITDPGQTSTTVVNVTSC